MDENDVCHVEVLKKLHVHLLENIGEPILITDRLFSASRQFTVFDKELIECGKSRLDQNRALLKSLQKKDRHIFEVFIDALDQTGQGFLIPDIRKEEALLVLRKLLLKKYVAEPQSRVHLKTIEEQLHDRYKSYIEKENIIATVHEVFQQALFQEDKQYFLNLTYFEEKQKESSAIQNNMTDGERNVTQISQVCDWNETDVGNWLQSIGIKDNEIVQKFKSLMINGEALLELEETDLKEEIPELKLGQRKIFLKRRKELAHQSPPSTSDVTSKKQDILDSTVGGQAKSSSDLSEAESSIRTNTSEKVLDSKNVVSSSQLSPSTHRKQTSVTCLTVPNQAINHAEIVRDKKDQNDSLSVHAKIIEQKPVHTSEPQEVTADIGSSTQSKTKCPLNPKLLHKNLLKELPRDEKTFFIEETPLLSPAEDVDIIILRKLSKFICACLNSRVDGSCFIGLDSEFNLTGWKLLTSLATYKADIERAIRQAFCENADTVVQCIKSITVEEVIFAESSCNICEIYVQPEYDICKNLTFQVKPPKSGKKRNAKQILYFVEEKLSTLKKTQLLEYVKSADAQREKYEQAEKLKPKGLNAKTCIVQLLRKQQDSETSNTDFEIHSKCQKNSNTEVPKSPSSEDKKEKSTDCQLQSSRQESMEKTPERNSASQELDKLAKLLCLGDDTAVNDLYPILVVNTPNQDQADLSHVEFIGKVPWKVVFQFGGDDNKLLRLFEQSSKVDTKIIPSADAFSSKSTAHMKNPEKLQSLKDDIESSLNAHFSQTYTGPHWVYANSTIASSSQDLQQWNREQRSGLKEAISLYDNLIPRGRGVVVFLALSDETSVMVEAMTEFISHFQDQWVMITEHEDKIGRPIIDELLRRNFMEEVTLKERSVMSLPWKDIRHIVNKMYNEKVLDSYKLASTASDNFIVVSQQWKNRLTDLEILSANECESVDVKECQEEVEREEMKYYNGAEVSWLNFHSKTHVCERDALREIKQCVKDGLKSGSIDETYVQKVLLYHQPGAGGTTVARNVLWDLKDTYRCAIVKNISENTVKQIVEFRSHLDSNPKPVLLLMDNLDEEPSNVLVSQMEEKSKQIIRSEVNNDGNTPVCVFLICWRKNQLPQRSRPESGYNQAFRGVLGHNLSKHERQWWRQKSLELENRDPNFQNFGDSRVNPNLLISFNIMKSNFDKDFIERMTKNLVEKIEHPKERELLKYVALLNAFDVNFRTIPASCFDLMMMDFALSIPSARKSEKTKKRMKSVIFHLSEGPAGVYSDRGSQIRAWISKLSLEFKLLMNDPSPFAQRSITNLRITNPLLSKEILKVLQKLEGNNQTVSGMALQLLECKEIFNVKGIARNKIITTVVDIMKRRERAPSGKPETYFAPMIQYIVEEEDIERASRVMEKVFEITQDAFIAQHIARINIYSQNWDKAIAYAGKATTIFPESSILWDTRGRIYQRRLAEEYKLLSASHHVEVTKVVDLIQKAYKGIKYFYKAQELSEREQIGFQNNVGYLGQLEITQLLFMCLSKASCFPSKEMLTKFLLDEKQVPEELQEVLLEMEEDNHRQLLQDLRDIVFGVEKAIRKLEDERMQLKEPSYLDEYRSKSEMVNHDRLDEIKANLYDFLREEYILPDNINQKDACKIRSRQIRILGGNSFWSIFEMMTQEGGVQRLHEIKDLCLENINSELPSAEDFETLIAVCLAIVQCRADAKNEIQYAKLAEWSKILYKKRATIQGGKTHLEPYLFYVMFNWPRENSSEHYITTQQLQDALENWKSAYNLKYPKQKNQERKAVTKEGTTIYFFARGKDMLSVFKARELKRSVGQNSKGDAFWREETVLRTLQRFNGVLRNEGEEVEIRLTYPNNDTAVITIPTSLPKKDRSLWHKRVYFVIGFTWIGAKAFDVTREDPTQTLDLREPQQDIIQAEIETDFRRPNKLTYFIVLQQLEEANARLKELESKAKKRTLNEERELKELKASILRLEFRSNKIIEKLNWDSNF